MQQMNDSDMTKMGSLEKDNLISSNAAKIPLILTGFLFSLMALYAVSLTMVGPIMPSIIDDHQLRLSQGGLIITAQSIGGILAILLGGLTADRFNKSRLIWFSFFSFGLALLLVSFVHVYALLLLTFFILGAGSRMTDTILNAYVSDLYQARRGYYLNLLHTFFGVGALTGPIYARFIMDRELSWSLVFRLLGIICLLLIFFMPLVLKSVSRQMASEDGNDFRKSSIKQEPGASQKSATGMTTPVAGLSTESEQQPALGLLQFVKNSPVIWLICLVMILYVGHQVSLSIWIPMYMESYLLVNPTISSLALSVLWLGIIIGRVGSAYLTGKVSVFKILLGGSLIGAVFMMIGILLQQPLVLIITLGLTGLFTGSVIPLLVTLACDRYPTNSGTASSLIFLSGTFSTMLFPWLVGRLAELFSFQTAMMLTWMTLFLMFGLVIVLRKIYYRPEDV